MSKVIRDKVLQECIDEAYEHARLGRGDGLVERDRVLVETLIELETVGVAMRYVDAKGRIAWRSTKLIRDHLEDLRLDAESDFEDEDT
jgi:hypothetical protein